MAQSLFGTGENSIFSNKLLIQYLAGMGQDIGQGNAGFPTVNAITQQNVQTQNYAKMLQQLLSGGGKVTMDSENINIKAPAKAFQNPGADPGQTGLNYQGKTQLPSVGELPTLPTSSAKPRSGGATGGADSMLTQLLMGNSGANPSASPLGDLSPSDLAGLTPQDISQALQFKMAQDATGREQINDTINNMYKLALIEQGQAQTNINRSKELRAWEELYQKAPLEVPGLGQVSMDTWEKLDTKTKAYSYYAFNAKQNNEEVLSYNEFITQSDPATMIEYYEEAKKDPEFRKFFFDAKAASATQINVSERVEETAKAKGRTYFKGDWAKDVEAYMSTEDVQNKLFRIENKEERSTAAVGERINFIERQMISRGATIQDVYWEEDARTMTWEIKWPNGQTEKVSYGVRD